MRQYWRWRQLAKQYVRDLLTLLLVVIFVSMILYALGVSITLGR